jgi:hypothetical protein
MTGADEDDPLYMKFNALTDEDIIAGKDGQLGPDGCALARFSEHINYFLSMTYDAYRRPTTTPIHSEERAGSSVGPPSIWGIRD